MRKFCCDFETTTYFDEDNRVRVWAFACIEIGNLNNYFTGNCIEDFLTWCEYNENYTLYFHNLKFDGEFIINELFKQGYKYVKTNKELESKTFTTLISDMGIFYSIEICFKKQGHKTNKVTIFDSLKLLNFKVSEIAKAFDLPISKLEINYHTKREKGHILTQQEKDYIRNDVEIVARALEIMFNRGFDKMTIGSNALADYKHIMGKNFEKNFPSPDYDSDIRQSYKGGYVYLNPLYAGNLVGRGLVFDVNSLYPSRMRYELMPYGTPIKFKGKYVQDDLYNLYIVTFTCNFKLKPNKLPTIQIHNNLSFCKTEYLTSSKGEDVTLCLTSVDLKLFYEHYDVTNEEWQGGYKFKSTLGLFDTYIDKWIDEKIQASKEKNKGKRTIAKLFLNSLYGKFSLNPVCATMYPVYIDEKVSYLKGETEYRNPLYLPVGTFITSYARYYTITTSQKIRDYSLEKYGVDMYIYSDTDSIHTLLTLEDAEQIIDVDDNILGYWKAESKFIKAKFLRQKSYLEMEISMNDKKYNYHWKANKPYARCKVERLRHYKHTEKYIKIDKKITVAGMPQSCYQFVTLENFSLNSSYAGKLQSKRVAGGTILKEIDFTFKGGKVENKKKLTKNVK